MFSDQSDEPEEPHNTAAVLSAQQVYHIAVLCEFLSGEELGDIGYFIEHQGATLSRNEILRDVWGYQAGTYTRTADVHVASLRQKLEKVPKKPEMILTIPGIGYRFQMEPLGRANPGLVDG